MTDLSIQSKGNAGGVPKGLLLGALALVAFAVVSTAASRVSDIGAVHMPVARAIEILSLGFEDLDDGGVAVRDVTTNKVIYTVAPGTNGFIRATMRGLTRERKRSGIGESTPFHLTRWSDGAMSLEDETTGRRVNLEAFGPTNAEAFAQLFTKHERAK